MDSRSNFEYIELTYENILENPNAMLGELQDFLELPLELKDMVKIIDKSLHRNK